MRILQITDSHLVAEKDTPYKGVNTFDQLKQVIADIKKNGLEKCPVIFTGDNSQDASYASYDHLKELTTNLHGELFAIPGNHDSPQKMEETLSSFKQSGIYTLGSWDVILLNSHVPNVPFGSVSANSLNTIETYLKASKRPCLVAIHHHPYEIDSPWMDNIMLKNGRELLNTLSHYTQVKGLIFGHVHQEFDAYYKHIRLLGTPSSSHQFLPGAVKFQMDLATAGYRWIDLQDNGDLESGINRLG